MGDIKHTSHEGTWATRFLNLCHELDRMEADLTAVRDREIALKVCIQMHRLYSNAAGPSIENDQTLHSILEELYSLPPVPGPSPDGLDQGEGKLRNKIHLIAIPGGVLVPEVYPFPYFSEGPQSGPQPGTATFCLFYREEDARAWVISYGGPDTVFVCHEAGNNLQEV